MTCAHPSSSSTARTSQAVVTEVAADPSSFSLWRNPKLGGMPLMIDHKGELRRARSHGRLEPISERPSVEKVPDPGHQPDGEDKENQSWLVVE